MTTTAPTSAPGPMLADTRLAQSLDALRYRTRPAFPPAELVARYDPELGAELATAVRARNEAVAAAAAWQRATAGDGFTEALEAERAYTLEALKRGEDPPARSGPLYEHLVSGIPAFYVTAVRSEARAEHHEQALRARAGKTAKLRERLDRESDELRDRMAELLERARDRKNRRALDDAAELREEWGACTSLYVWLADPTQSWRARGHAWPEELGMAGYEADGAISGTPGPLPPLEGAYTESYGGPRIVDAEIRPKPARRRLFGR